MRLYSFVYWVTCGYQKVNGGDALKSKYNKFLFLPFMLFFRNFGSGVIYPFFGKVLDKKKLCLCKCVDIFHVYVDTPQTL